LEVVKEQGYFAGHAACRGFESHLVQLDCAARCDREAAGACERAPEAGVTHLSNQLDWKKLGRLIVITDEQPNDGILPAWTAQPYVVNVAPYQHGFSYGSGWTHIDGP